MIPEDPNKQAKLDLMIPMAELKGAKRLDGESFEDYKHRRRIEQKSIKHHLRGRFVTVETPEMREVMAIMKGREGSQNA